MRKRERNIEKRTFNDRVADTFEGSKEIFLDVPKLVFIGNRELSIENYKGICEYTESLLTVETKPCRIRLEGSALEVKSITGEMLYVTGEISRIEFLKEA